MEELKIKKSYFVDDEPSEKVWQIIVSGMHSPVSKKRSLIARYKHRYKIAVLPVVGVFFIFGGYILYQNTHPSLAQEITNTKNAITNYVSLNDNEIF